MESNLHLQLKKWNITVAMGITFYFVLVLSCFARVDGLDGSDFYSACRAGNITSIEESIENGLSVSSRDSKGNTCIIIASGRGQTETVQYLLSKGANPEDSTQFGIFEGKSCIGWASSQGRVETVELLINAGTDPNRAPEVGVFAGKTALMWASSQGRLEVVKALLAAGVDVDYTSSSGNFQGKSSLMWASSQGRMETVEALLEAGADVNAVDVDGVSALMWAAGSEATGEEGHKKGIFERATKGHVRVVQLLLQYGANPDMRDKDGITATMFACYHGHVGAVQVLLNWGSNADYMSREGKTALQLARNSGHADSAQAVLSGPNFMTVTVEDLKNLSACGWLLSVLRAPHGTGVMVDRGFRDLNYQPKYSIHNSCRNLKQNGLDGSLFDLLQIVHGSSIESIIPFLGLDTFGATVRAKMQLEVLYKRSLRSLIDVTQYYDNSTSLYYNV
mmetsp:Transcript_725/g.1253  ORF Transcript_725/g.1253 Transcript_725/m.1253 type:complete len:449 (+) Transcript_725:335-1681(+)